MKVFVVVDNSKECYDCHQMFMSVHATYKGAKDSINTFGVWDRSSFEILEEDVEEE